MDIFDMSGEMTRKYQLFNEHEPARCSDCNRSPKNPTEVDEHWYEMPWGEGVSGWTPEQTKMYLCQPCQVRALDLIWSRAVMRPLKSTGRYIVEIALRTNSSIPKDH